MWSAASAFAEALPSPMGTFVLGGMNDVLNSQGYTQGARWNRIPTAAWILLITIAIFCNLLVGYDAPGRNAFFPLILPIALSISLFLIADIDSRVEELFVCSRKISRASLILSTRNKPQITRWSGVESLPKLDLPNHFRLSAVRLYRVSLVFWV
jgi:hypothetical protein